LIREITTGNGVRVGAKSIADSCDAAYYQIQSIWTRRRLAESGQSAARLLGCGSGNSIR
jgi:hypothetical protein